MVRFADMEAVHGSLAKRPDVYDILFRVGMWWRILYGGVRVLLGLTLLRLVGTPLDDVFYRAMRFEIAEEPRDFLSHTIGSFLHHHSYTVTYFLAAYLIFWGTVDAVLSASLLRDKLWAFPVSMYLIALFMLYEIYRVAHTHSLILGGIILMDIGLLWLINKEYRKRLHHRSIAHS